VNDLEAREYAIAALGAIAGELRPFRPDDDRIAVQRRLAGLADRVLEAAHRLNEERDELDLADVAAAVVQNVDERLERLERGELDVAERLGRLEEHVDAIGRRVIGGPPAAGIVPLDGEELDRDPEPSSPASPAAPLS